MTELMTNAEVAAMLRVPESTLRYWHWKGAGPASLKVGRRRVYRRSDVEEWVEGRMRKAPRQ